VHTFIGAPKGKSSEAAHITSASTPLSVLLLFFAEIITLLVVETNRYYQQFLDSSNKKPPPQHEVKEAEMFAFLALTLHMGHTVQGRLEDYWTKMEQLCCPFYGHTMSRGRYYHILRFLHFTDNNNNGVDRIDDRLWKTRDLFEIIRTNFSKFYSYILLSACGGKKISHRDFRLTVIREMLARSGHEPRPSKPVGRPAPSFYWHRKTGHTSQ